MQRYAATRYPFSSFIVYFEDNVGDKLGVEYLSSESSEAAIWSDLRIIGYRRSQVNCPQREYDVLLFVETTGSFEFLYDDAHWPSQLLRKDLRLSKPSILLELSAAIQNVSLDNGWDDFIGGHLQAMCHDIVKIIRLKNQNLQNLKSVIIEIKSIKTCNEIL